MSETKKTAETSAEKVTKTPTSKPAASTDVKTTVKKAIENPCIQAVGRRKTSVARIALREGSGKITINKRTVEHYFGRETSRMIINQPLELLEQTKNYDLAINVYGGGSSGQAGAIRLAITNALIKFNADFKPSLRKAGFVTRDSRIVERKKVGLHKARKKPQFSKR